MVTMLDPVELRSTFRWFDITRSAPYSTRPGSPNTRPARTRLHGQSKL